MAKEGQQQPIDEREISLKLLIVLMRAAQSVRKGIEADIRHHGLNLTAFSVLELLYHKGDQPIQQISGKILIASSSTTYVVDQLQKKRLIIRKPCPGDRRVTFASLTDEGRSLMERIFPKHREAVHALLGGLPAEEKKTLIDMLKKLGLFAADQLG
ncbi:MarR family transcriptional regulator [Sporolactobacillus sp. CPB3-1]|uniref:MarR family transcriptional regulator n=1 Tax=Sporolactobacillus mangiferae TaxID=2940498 RepID=A0ABT0M9R1_9BACL|nr:MarR family transcriptional regulator [Sporolactobacillus mangiferae]MCL1631616.1 MarR family transcriptional regulator [Sporolactobacillus mangiferae]